jgi:alpha-N-acetylglucosaminidase
MKKYILLLLILPSGLMAADFDGVQQLAARRVPWLAPHLTFRVIAKEKGNDVFEIVTKNNKIQVAASGANAAAVALNWYLKYYCHRSMSHMGDNLSPVSPLPVVKQPVKITASAMYRYALNYCTYNYTMSFYTWKDWEHELDWMALNGVNLMLVANGAEAVWQNVLKQLGYTAREISDFITGPAYNAWWLMGNIQGWGGPMPQSQVDHRKLLVQKMIARMQSLGIEPVMPAFYGMVPSTLKNKTRAHIITQGSWGAFTRPDILDPTDTAFKRMAAIFYTETKKLYGKHIRFFSGDPFHEGGITAGVDLGHAGAAIQQAMQQSFPGAIWVLQGWQDNPKKELLAKVDKSTVLVQELFGENTNNWETRKGYEGTPFIWCIVNNFGERPGLQGKLQRFAAEVPRIYNSEYRACMKGIGIMPEGINNNPLTYELLLETGWHQQPIQVEEWLKNYAVARYGKYNSHIEQAWKLLLQTTYSNPGYQEGPPENILCARPALQIKSVSSWGNLKKGYDTAVFLQAVQRFAKAAPLFAGSSTYKIDCINFVRQVLSNRADKVFAEWVQAYRQKNMAAFETAARQFLALASTTDELLNTDAWYRLSTYQQQALLAGNTPQEKKNNLLNAMMLITYWGEHNPQEDNLHEYAYKEWSGLMQRFYRKRWEIYFDYLRKQMKGEQVEAPDFFAWERKWVTDHLTIQKETAPANLEKIISRILFPAAGTIIGFASPDVRYDKDSAPAAAGIQTQWQTTAWKGEKVHTQLVIWHTGPLKNVRIQPGTLKNSKGDSIPASHITPGFVRYVLSDGLNKEGHGCGIQPGADSSWAADGIDFSTSKEVPAYTTQPVWISMAIPRHIPAGVYTGMLRVIAGGIKRDLVYTVNVQQHILPEPAAWRFHLDLWQNPYAVARVHQVPVWSKAHVDALKPYMQLLANAGQKTITVSMIYDPWRGQTYDIYGSMIKWIKKKDGAWRYDYTIFDQWVHFMMRLGIDKLINCYTMVPWNNKFYYYDETLGADTLLIAKTGTPEYIAHWRPMLTDFIQHLKQKGWYHKTAIAMDERPLGDMQQVIALVRSIDKDLKISLAGSYHAEIANEIYDYCIASAENFDTVVQTKRLRANLPSTFYTYCWEGRPNTFVFSPPAEAAWLGWYAANKRYNGYLRWAYNCWPQKPLQDARFSTWSAGDTYFVYPGPGTSIRFERLTEGIQDYEKIRLLKESFTQTGQHKKLQQLQQVINTFEIAALEKTTAADMLQKAKVVLNTLSEPPL